MKLRSKQASLSGAFMIGRFLPERKIHKKENYEKERIHQSYIIGNSGKVHQVLLLSLRCLARINDRIPRIHRNVNKGRFGPAESCGSINTTANQATDTFTKNSESISSQMGESVNMSSFPRRSGMVTPVYA